jgi:hypothetical protein
MGWIKEIRGALDEQQRGALIYSGKLLVFKQVPAVQRLCALADELITEAFKPHVPQKAQFELGRGEFLSLAATTQRRFRKHPESRKLFRSALEEVGVDIEHSYWDRLLLRVLPHGDTHAGGLTSRAHIHRDTWGSNLYQQTNWWTPVYTLTAERTIVFYPDYWPRAVANTSASWSYDEYVADRRHTGPGLAPSYPPAPQPQQVIDATAEMPVVIDPGDMLCFSGAHLHASAANVSGCTRFSVESRTVNIDDVKHDRAAPNIDCQARQARFDWFRHVVTNEPLTDIRYVEQNIISHR